MKLLSEMTINSTLHRLSGLGQQNVEHPWMPFIKKITPTKWGLPELYGGHADAKYGVRVFPATFFFDNWPPPRICQCRDLLTDTNEADAITIYEGDLLLDSASPVDGVVSYTPRKQRNEQTVDAVTFSGSLVDQFAWACDAARLNLTLDSSAAIRNPDVYYPVTGTDNNLVDLLTDMAQFFCHAFRIDQSAGTLELIDLTVANGTATFNQFQFYEGVDRQAAPLLAKVTAKSGGNEYHATGSDPNGEPVSISPVCHNVQSDIEAALASIKTILEYDQIRIPLMPLAAQIPKIGQRLEVTYAPFSGMETTYWMQVTDIIPDISKQRIVVEGFGGVV